MMTEEFHDLGNGVTLSVHVARGRPIHSTGFVELRFTTVATWANGLIERFLNYIRYAQGGTRTDGLVERATIYTDIDQARATADRLAKERS